MLTKKDILPIIILILSVIALLILTVWLALKVAPILIGALILIPWIAQGLTSGANVK